MPTPLRPLTRREGDALAAVDRFHELHGYCPSVRDIQEALKLASTSTAHRYLAALRELGLIRWDPTRTRTIRRS